MKTHLGLTFNLFFLLVIFANGQGLADGGRIQPKGESLVLRGKVNEVTLVREDKQSIVLKLKLSMEFVNQSDKPIIILRRKFWQGAEMIGRTPEEASSSKYLYIGTHWPSVDEGVEWQRMRRSLDQTEPPTELTMRLLPGEAYPYETEITLYFEKAGSLDGTRQRWDKILQASPVWLRVSLEIWPINLEPDVDPSNPSWGKWLQRRWQNYGNLWLDRLTSEPMRLDLSSFAKAGQGKPDDGGAL
ncbi:MAG: hypothetical protein HONDAALG_04165 [Gammaproteobacteria bacterium]|nr:hypothetical protein [Gammaproteobacteria bacterium]